MKHIKNTAFATITILAATAFIACQDNRGCTFDQAANKLECPEKTYSTIVMGGNTWMAENLAVYTPDSSICYDNNHQNCETDGRLYSFDAAMSSACPLGWGLPTREDFKAAFEGKTVAELKNKNSFNLQFAGFKYYDGKFADRGQTASFWTADAFDDSRAYMVRVTDSAYTFEHFNKNIDASVRCIKK